MSPEIPKNEVFSEKPESIEESSYELGVEQLDPNKKYKGGEVEARTIRSQEINTVAMLVFDILHGDKETAEKAEKTLSKNNYDLSMVANTDFSPGQLAEDLVLVRCQEEINNSQPKLETDE